MNMNEVTPPMMFVLFICSVVGFEVLKLTVSLVFGRLVSPGFVKISDCKTCGENQLAADKGLKKDIRAIKRVLFSMATNGEVNEDDLKDLVT